METRCIRRSWNRAWPSVELAARSASRTSRLGFSFRRLGFSFHRGRVRVCPHRDSLLRCRRHLACDLRRRPTWPCLFPERHGRHLDLAAPGAGYAVAAPLPRAPLLCTGSRARRRLCRRFARCLCRRFAAAWTLYPGALCDSLLAYVVAVRCRAFARYVALGI